MEKSTLTSCTGFRVESTPVYLQVAEDLLKCCIFKTLKDTEEILIYTNGIYVPNGEAIIKERAKNLLGVDFTAHRVREIQKYIAYSILVKREEFNCQKSVLNLQNGLLDLATCELRPARVQTLSRCRRSRRARRIEVTFMSQRQEVLGHV